MKTTALMVLIFSLCGTLSLTAIAAEGTPQIDPALELIHALGCKGCHRINGEGGSQATDLTQVGSRLTAKQIEAKLAAANSTRSKGFMPSYNSMPKDNLKRISDYLYNLRQQK